MRNRIYTFNLNLRQKLCRHKNKVYTYRTFDESGLWYVACKNCDKFLGMYTEFLGDY